jgi:hypothetical protein
LSRILILGAFILAPYAVSVLVLRTIRKGEQAELAMRDDARTS